MINNETTKEIAKATKEVAKTIRAYEPIVNKTGASIGKILAAPLEEIGGLIADKLRQIRIENWIKFQPKLKSAMNKSGITEIRELSPRITYDLIEAISIEDNDELQDMWANLMANALNPKIEMGIDNWQISILRQLSPLEAKILHSVVHIPEDKKELFKDGVTTYKLPDGYHKFDKHEKPLLPPPNIQLAISRLVALGCFVDTGAFPGDRSYWVKATPIAEALIEACEIKR